MDVIGFVSFCKVYRPLGSFGFAHFLLSFVVFFYHIFLIVLSMFSYYVCYFCYISCFKGFLLTLFLHEFVTR
jgi:hypothetical protein